MSTGRSDICHHGHVLAAMLMTSDAVARAVTDAGLGEESDYDWSGYFKATGVARAP